MRGKPGELHQRYIGEILAEFPDAATTGFPAAMRALREEVDAEPCELDSCIRPDAFRLDRDGEWIEIYEVEVYSMLSERKITELGEWWFDWDSEDGSEWLPVLILIDRYGHRNRVDLRHAYSRTGPFTPVRLNEQVPA
jgi:hypothetical protein